MNRITLCYLLLLMLSLAQCSATSAAPLTWDGTLHFGCNDNLVHYVDAEAFASPAGSDNLGSSVIASTALSTGTGQLFACTLDGRIYAFELVDIGAYDLIYDLQRKVRSSPALANGRLYIVAGDSGHRYLYCFGP